MKKMCWRNAIDIVVGDDAPVVPKNENIAKNKNLCNGRTRAFAPTAIILFILFILSGCSGINAKSANFFAMDTLANATVISRDNNLNKELLENIESIIKEAENKISKTKETSFIYQRNNTNSELDKFIEWNIPKEVSDLLELCGQINVKTGGAFDIGVGELIDLWGINDNIESAERKLPEKVDFDLAMENLKNRKFKYDLGAIGKGWSLDLVRDYLDEKNINNALISFESSILALGKNKKGKLWSVGLKSPVKNDVDSENSEQNIAGIISASNKYISVSGGYERYININGKDYCHIIDPETGYPVDNDLLSVAVIMEANDNNGKNDNGAISDALSTALFVMGKEKALEFYKRQDYSFEMILFVKDESKARGYDIIATNVSFEEIKNN